MNKFPELPMANRQCGECTACCTVMGVQELGKGFYFPCEHIGEGCKIYAERPPTCESFKCLWLAYDIMPSGCRPDKLGVMFQAVMEEQSLALYEVRQGALLNADVWKLVPEWEKMLGKTFDLMGEKFQGLQLFPHNAQVKVLFEAKPPYPKIPEGTLIGSYDPYPIKIFGGDEEFRSKIKPFLDKHINDQLRAFREWQEREKTPKERAEERKQKKKRDRRNAR